MELNATKIKKLEQQFGYMLAILTQHQLRTLLSNTVQNPKNDRHYLAITTWRGKANIDLPMPIIDEVRDDIIDVDDVSKVKVEKLVTNTEISQKSMGGKK